MTLEQAIEKLNDIRCHVKETSTEEQALVMAINALQGTTSDLISRQAAIDALCAINDKYNENPHIDAIIDAIEALPPAQPERAEGEWIPHETPEDNEAYFCPKCGAKMTISK